MITAQDVRNAYRLILGRQPENEAVVAEHAKHFRSIDELRLAFLQSEEFNLRFRQSVILELPSSVHAQQPCEKASEIIFLQTSDPNEYLGMLAASAQTVREYCNKNRFGYEVYIGIKQGRFPWHACFNRIFLLKELCDRGFRGWAVYIDADAIIANQNFNLREYLQDKSRFAAIMSHAGWGQWWNVNNGVMILNFSHSWTRWLVQKYHELFIEICQPRLDEATVWGSVPHDQDLLQQVLASNELNRSHVFREDFRVLNFADTVAVGTLPSPPFVQHILRECGTLEERQRIIAERVKEIVSNPPSTWHAALLTLRSPGGGDAEHRSSTSADQGGARNETIGHAPSETTTPDPPKRSEPAAAASPYRPLDWPAIEVEYEATPEQLAIMAAHIEANWRRLGEWDPHWSVMTDERFRASNIANAEEEFYQSGRSEFDKLRRTAERCGIPLEQFSDCLELGCGVGRTTWSLAEYFNRVIAVDISRSHLDICRAVLDARGMTNVEFLQLMSLASLDRIGRFDALFSIIVLQHNPPPLIMLLLKHLLSRLAPGGIAYFQVPTYKTEYKFSIEEYLSSAYPDRGMEMHLIPQPVLFKLLHECGCRLLECREDSCTGDFTMISNTVFVQKEEPPRRRWRLPLRFRTETAAQS